MIIEIAGKEFEAKPCWRWVSIDDDGCIIAFWNKPSFQYWGGYRFGRYWDVSQDDHYWEHLGCIDENLVPRESLIKL